jgi:hypothetical protein
MIRVLYTAVLLVLGLLANGGAAAAPADYTKFVESYTSHTVFIQVYANEADFRNDVLEAQGSGVLLQSGYVLTSLHLLGEADEAGFEASLADKVVKARVGLTEGVEPATLHFVDQEARHDLALFRFDPGLSRDFAYSCVRRTSVSIGEKLAILGFPGGMSIELSTNEVTGLDANRIRTQAAVTFGSSGSGVYDLDGLLIGIVRGGINVGGKVSDISAIVPIRRANSLLGFVEEEVDSKCPRPVVIDEVVASVSISFTLPVSERKEREFTEEVNYNSSSRSWDCRPFSYQPATADRRFDVNRSSVTDTGQGNSRGQLRDVSVRDVGITFNICARRRITDSGNGYRHALVRYVEYWYENRDEPRQAEAVDVHTVESTVIPIPEGAKNILVTVKLVDGRTYALAGSGTAGDAVAVQVQPEQGVVIVEATGS